MKYFVFILIFIISHCNAAEEKKVAEIQFDREKMNLLIDNDSLKVEGYWASNKDIKLDEYKGRYPFPKLHNQPWPGKEEFLKALKFVESKAELSVSQGYSKSRLDGSQLSCGEYFYQNVFWPEDYAPHYIEKYNVIPSREFYDFILSTFNSDQLK